MKGKCTVCLLFLVLLATVFVLVRICLACNLPPVAILVITYDGALTEPKPVTLDGSASHDPEGPDIKEYWWDFDGDGNYDYAESVSKHPDGDFDGITTHVYDRPGTYVVKLMVVDVAGGIGTATASLTYSGDINFSLAVEPYNKVKISYVTTGDFQPRSIALKFKVQGGTLNSVSWKNPYYAKCYMDYAHDHYDTYTYGDGQPVAYPNGPGAPASISGLTEISINMAEFNENRTGAPEQCDLITLFLNGSYSTATVTLSEDTLRSSFHKTGVTTNLPLTKQVYLYGVR